MLTGYIEGYYGIELSWKERDSIISKLKDTGCNTYFYCPKEIYPSIDFLNVLCLLLQDNPKLSDIELKCSQVVRDGMRHPALRQSMVPRFSSVNAP